MESTYELGSFRNFSGPLRKHRKSTKTFKKLKFLRQCKLVSVGRLPPTKIKSVLSKSSPLGISLTSGEVLFCRVKEALSLINNYLKKQIHWNQGGAAMNSDDPRHCSLSIIAESIFYFPHCVKFTHLLKMLTSRVRKVMILC